jgi:hypothetical protein
MKKFLALIAVLCLFIVTPAFADSTASVNDVTANVTVNFPDPVSETTANLNNSGLRGYPVGIQMTYPNLMGYFGKESDGASVTDLATWLAYGNTMDLATLKMMANQSGLDFFGSGIKTVTVAQSTKVEESAQPAIIKAVMKDKVKGSYKRVATITVKATDLNTTTEKLLAVAALEAAAYGASEIHIIDSGKFRVMTGSGWGIGVYYYGATISGSEKSSGVGGGGTGYSTAESGYQDKPWIKVIAVIPGN